MNLFQYLIDHPVRVLLHPFRLLQSKLRERSNRELHNPKWAEVERTFLEKEFCCQACGDVKQLQVHHAVPFIIRPELELEKSNLIVLCMGFQECHLRIAHGGDFKFYNPNVLADIVHLKASPQDREDVEHEAEIARRKL